MAGEIGVSGLNALLAVEAQTKAERGYVTILLHNMEEMIVPLMDHQIQKPKDATKTLAQLMEHLVLGMNGAHAPLSVEAEIKQGHEDVTTLCLNLVAWNVMATLLNANAVTWILALQNALLKTDFVL